MNNIPNNMQNNLQNPIPNYPAYPSNYTPYPPNYPGYYVPAPKPPKTKSFWRGFSLSMAFFAMFFGGLQIFASIYVVIAIVPQMIAGMDVNSVSGTDPSAVSSDIMNIPNIGTIAMTAQFVGWIFAIAGILLLYKLIKVHGIKRPLFKSLELGKIRPVTILWSIAAGLGMSGFVNAALALLPVPDVMYEQFNDAFSMFETTPQWMLLLGIGIVGPIAEELALRSGVFSVMRRDSNFWVAAVVSSLLFGLMHMIPLQICYATVIGFILAVVCHLTKSVWPAIIIHIVNNSWSFMMPESTSANVEDFLFGGGTVTWISLAIGAVLVAVSLLVIAKIEKSKQWQISYEMQGV